MKKVLISLFFICLFFLPVMADYTVDSVAVNAEVSSNGKTQVTSTTVLTFTSGETEVTIPLPDEDVSHVSVSNYRYRVKQTDFGTNVVVSNGDGFAGTHTFQITYSLPAFTDGSSSEDLYHLNLLSSRWAREIGSVSVQITLPGSQVELPEGFSMEPQILSGYYGDLDPVDAPMEAVGNTLTGSVSQRMAYDSLAVEVSLPEGYFRMRSTSIPMISITWVCLAMAAVTALCMLYWHFKLRNPAISYSARLLAPEGILPYQLPQVLDGSSCDMAALILEWANLGYISLGYNKSQQVILRRNMHMGSERTAAEQQLFSQIFGRSSRVVATPGRFSASASRFRAASRRSVSQVAFDRSGGNPVLIQLPARLLLAVAIGYMVYKLLPEGAGFVVLAVFAGIAGFVYSMYLHSAVSTWRSLGQFGGKTLGLVLIAVILIYLGLISGAFLETCIGMFACCFSAVATASGPRRSAWGRDMMAQAKGCRRFYRQVSWQKLQIYLGHNNRFFQSELPKAVALNCDKTFAARFERLSIPRPDWLPGVRKQTWSAPALQKQLTPIVKKLRAAFN